MAFVRTTITAENRFTEAIKPIGAFNVLISGLSDSTVTLQGSFDQVTWYDAASWDAATDNGMHEGRVGDENGIWFRIGVKTGEYGTDTVVVAIGW